MHERNTEALVSDLSLGTPEEQHESAQNDSPPPPKRQRLSIQGPSSNPTVADPILHPGEPGALKRGPRFSSLPPQNKPMWMTPPPSRALNGGDEGQGGSKDVWVEYTGRNSLDHLGQTSSAATPPLAPGVPGTSASGPQAPPTTTNGAPNTGIAPSIPFTSGAPLNSGPMANQQTLLYNTASLPDFMKESSNSLNVLSNMDNGDIDFERDFGRWFDGDDIPPDPNLFPNDGDINFERDFGQWFAPLDMKNVPYSSKRDFESESPAHHTESMFKSALRGYTFPLVTLREFKMMAVMNMITDKHDWHEKVFDDKITKKWRKEAIDADQAVTEAMVDWCIEELRYRSKIFEATGIVTAYDADVVKSDSAVPEDLKTALANAVRPLEGIPAVKKDWHPGSDGKVLDLVDPSIFPLVYGVSRVLTNSVTNLDDCINRCGEGADIAFCGYMDLGIDSVYPNKFQWLPCDVDISSDLPKITSYINNLHPHRHRDLYSIIEKIIKCAIPLWNAALTPQRTTTSHKTRISINQVEAPNRPVRQSGESSEDYWARFEIWLQEAEAEQPEVGPFALDKLPPRLRQADESMNGSMDGSVGESIDGSIDESMDKLMDESMHPKHVVDLKRQYAHGGLQVIVKLANIYLTPEKPEYEGGTWHVEGQSNECICATAIYCYDSENISGGSLAFRQIVNPEDVFDITYEHLYHRWLTDIFGCHNEEPAIQYIGSVDAREGRLLAFPNIIQNKAQPLKLTDPTRPGHQKILVLFLVDPNIRIVSTANVLCQRLDWWREALEARKVLQGLPLELKDLVYDQVEGFPISMQMAKELRLELMEERKNYTVMFEDSLELFWLE